ncbi:hypothetical protein FQN52_004973 [Onygenales sp. PD_12]|nr:hypothetical protein FQN52_004973 [Onygenales sp. PD_12]
MPRYRSRYRSRYSHRSGDSDQDDGSGNDDTGSRALVRSNRSGYDGRDRDRDRGSDRERDLDGDRGSVQSRDDDDDRRGSDRERDLDRDLGTLQLGDDDDNAPRYGRRDAYLGSYGTRRNTYLNAGYAGEDPRARATRILGQIDRDRERNRLRTSLHERWRNGEYGEEDELFERMQYLGMRSQEAVDRRLSGRRISAVQREMDDRVRKDAREALDEWRERRGGD